MKRRSFLAACGLLLCYPLRMLVKLAPSSAPAVFPDSSMQNCSPAGSLIFHAAEGAVVIPPGHYITLARSAPDDKYHLTSGPFPMLWATEPLEGES